MSASRRCSPPSIPVLVALIVTVSALGAMAQPPREAFGSSPARPGPGDGANSSPPQWPYRVLFQSNCQRTCDDGVSLAGLPGTRPGDGDGEGSRDPLADTKITIGKNANPADGTDFVFLIFRTVSFTLDDAVPDDGDAYGDSFQSSFSTDTTWQFRERLSIFWNLSSIGCSFSGDSTVESIRDDGILTGIAITPASGDHVICTFNNQRVPTVNAYLPCVSRD